MSFFVCSVIHAEGKARNGRPDRRLSAREVRFWGLLIAAVAFWANVARAGGFGAGETGALLAIVDNVLGNGAFDVLAWAIAFVLAAKISGNGPASPREISFVLLLGLAAAVPVRPASVVVLEGLAAWFLIDRGLEGAGRPVGLVLIALAAESLWTSPLFGPLHVLVGKWDAQVCAALLRLLSMTAHAHANVVENVGAGFSIVIFPLCTSSLPLSGVGLAFLVMVLYRGRSLRAAHLAWVGMAFIASILLTETRLMLLATSEASFEWWHGGPGLSIYGLAALGAAVVFPMLATWDTDAAPCETAERRVA